MKSERQNKRFTPIREDRQVSVTGDCTKANRLVCDESKEQILENCASLRWVSDIQQTIK